jgi:hypothetical protein
MSRYDFAPLSSAVNHRDIRQYRQEGYVLSEKMTPAYAYVPVVGSVFGVAGYLPAWVVSIFTDNDFYMVPIIVTFAAIGFIEGWYLCVTIPRRAWVRMVRLARFAELNNLRYTPETDGPEASGLLFVQPNVYEIFDDIHTAGSRTFEFGNAAVVKVKVVRPLKTYNWGFIHIKLGQHLPHVILDSRSGGHVLVNADLPTDMYPAQVKGIDVTHAIYTSKALHKNTLKQIFTPQLCHLITERLADYDIEITGTSLFIYRSQWFDFDQRETIEDILATIAEVGGVAAAK